MCCTFKVVLMLSSVLAGRWLCFEEPVESDSAVLCRAPGLGPG